MAEPKLLLVDEMSLGLAPVIYEELMPVVRRIADETGAGVLLGNSTSTWPWAWPTGVTSSTMATS